MRNTRFRRVNDAINSIGRCYIFLMTLCIAQVVWDIFSSDADVRNIHASSTTLVLRSLMFARIIFDIWKRSRSSLRTPIALLLFLDVVVNAFHMEQNTPRAYMVIDILWLIGVYIMYTGPSPREVIRGYRASAYQA